MYFIFYKRIPKHSIGLLFLFSLLFFFFSLFYFFWGSFSPDLFNSLSFYFFYFFHSWAIWAKDLLVTILFLLCSFVHFRPLESILKIMNKIMNYNNNIFGILTKNGINKSSSTNIKRCYMYKLISIRLVQKQYIKIKRII